MSGCFDKEMWFVLIFLRFRQKPYVSYAFVIVVFIYIFRQKPAKLSSSWYRWTTSECMSQLLIRQFESSFISPLEDSLEGSQ